MKVAEHEHPLTLIDLQVQYQQEEEDEEDDGDEEAGDRRTTKEGFHGVTCKRCWEKIHMYHRYYYKCFICDFSIHKFCGELPERLDHPVDPHPLIFRRTMVPDWSNEWQCDICWSWHKRGQGYHCKECDFRIDIECARIVGKNTIHHPCHPHLLMCLIPQPILCRCSACGEKHEGIFYQCSTCVDFTIHTDCAFLPETLLIQKTGENAFHHTHPLTISYSFSKKDQEAKHNPKCRVCGVSFKYTRHLWIYKCDECMYYSHVDCATSRTKQFKCAGHVKNYKDIDHPHLLHLPFPDDTYSLPKHLYFEESESEHEVNLTHESHQHPLTLVDCNGQTSEVIHSLLLLKCHDPMKKTQLLCNGCLRPITSTMPFYKCNQISCNFALHEWCTRLPPIIEDHPVHFHPLLLSYSQVLPRHFFGVFDCAVCRLPCNGFAYCCVKCGYYVDVTCGLLPKHITHESHPDHLLSLLVKRVRGKDCHMCLQFLRKHELSFRCDPCDVSIHPECALLLPKAIRHKYDKHPLNLSYLPIENHKSQYFCEICEEDLNPHESFYHCQHCAQSVHSACAPLILESEIETHSYQYHDKNIYYFVNIKFGGVFITDRHQHPLSFAQGTVLDGQCSMCNRRLQYEMIFKCLKCKLAVCYYCCYRGLNT